MRNTDGAYTIPLASNQGSHPASSGGRNNISEWPSPSHPPATSRANYAPSSCGRHAYSTSTPQHNLAPWEISVFEPSEFFQYGVGVGELDSNLSSNSLSDNWLTGAVENGSFGVDLTGLDWSEGARPAPDTTFDFSDVLQNDVYDHLLASTIPTIGEVPITIPSSTTVTPLQTSPSSTLSHDFSPETTPPFSTVVPAESAVQSNPRKRSPPVDPETALKRQRNNVAARKYRQKKIDRISELEGELKEVKDERDDLRVRLARQEAEVAALKSLFKMKAGMDI
ncbi:putative BZIP domain-containing protein [Seiridium cardinale]